MTKAERAELRWKQIPDWPYEASSRGDIRRIGAASPLKVRVDGGYTTAMIQVPGRRWKTKVSVLVALAFHGPRPAGKQCCHLDGDRQNNTPENLAWVTRQENEGHKRVHGTAPLGQNHPSAKLTNDIALRVAELAASGIPATTIGQRLGISSDMARRIALGKNWTHITGLKKRSASTIQRTQLTAEMVIEIRRLVAAGTPTKEIATQFSIGRNYVNQIARGDAWKHLK